jgi:DNA-binding NtrC family response regulator
VETVLVVEDNETVVGVVREILERNGYTVLVARTSGETFRINGQHEGIIHLMITDVVMPGMNGRELAERMRSARPSMKVLYMSGYIKDPLGGNGGLDEDVHFLQKPFTPDALLKKVREALGSPAMAIRHENPRGR